MTSPTPPLGGPGIADPSDPYFSFDRAEIGDDLLRLLGSACSEITRDPQSLSGAGQDWWPLTLHMSLAGIPPSLPSVIARPTSSTEVSAILSICNERRIPVTAQGGRSGVCGGAMPFSGGVAIDLCGLAGVFDLDSVSLRFKTGAGTFGCDLEAHLNGEGYTLGHWPQSMDLSTVGGWVACRSAGQYSTRYGKIEDMLTGLEVVTSSGEIIRIGSRGPGSSTGPGIAHLFLGSEGTLGVVTEAEFRMQPKPEVEAKLAFGFTSFAEGLEACRKILRRGATPAVLRLYDNIESVRNFSAVEGAGDEIKAHSLNVLVVVDEADPELLGATMNVVGQECAAATPLNTGICDRWISHRNDVSQLEPLVRSGVVVDTIEISAPWATLYRVYERSIENLGAITGTLNASAHLSHSYRDGACIYFTFAGVNQELTIGNVQDADRQAQQAHLEWATDYYAKAWGAVMNATIEYGGSISHHHGIGYNRAKFMAKSLGGELGLLKSLKAALDPNGILNPHKLWQ